PRAQFELHNTAPIVVALDRSVATVQSAQIAGTSTKLSITGTAAITGTRPLNLRADGDIGLDVLQAFSQDVFASGAITLNAAATGTVDQPALNGRLQLRNASVNMLDAPNGLSNGNGVIQFNGNQAVIQSLNGETGGGKISVTGFVNYGGPEM